VAVVGVVRAKALLQGRRIDTMILKMPA